MITKRITFDEILPIWRYKLWPNRQSAIEPSSAMTCEMCWSIPRKTALSAYTKFGFNTVGGYIETETADANIYVTCLL